MYVDEHGVLLYKDSPKNMENRGIPISAEVTAGAPPDGDTRVLEESTVHVLMVTPWCWPRRLLVHVLMIIYPRAQRLLVARPDGDTRSAGGYRCTSCGNTENRRSLPTTSALLGLHSRFNT